MNQTLFTLVLEPLVVGFFSVIGGVIPLIVILYVIFLLTRQSFQKFIASEPERVEKYKQMRDESKVTHAKFQSGLESKEIQMTPEISEAMTSLANSIYEYEMEIILREAWIERVKNADFISWVRFHFSNRYFADYFKK